MPLNLSHATGPSEPPLRDITLGALLAWAAETTPDRVALIEGRPDPAARRQWTGGLMRTRRGASFEGWCHARQCGQEAAKPCANSR
jgi:hypothetical protein